MRVELRTLDDFIGEVRDCLADGATLLENCVRFRIDRQAQQEEQISFDVFYHVTAVVQNANDRYLLDLSGVWAGEDDQESKAGTGAALEARERLESGVAPVKVRRGKIEVI